MGLSLRLGLVHRSGSAGTGGVNVIVSAVAAVPFVLDPNEGDGSNVEGL